MSLIAHPNWSTYSPHLAVEREMPAGRVAAIWFRASRKTISSAKRLRMACVVCGRPINPIRPIQGKASIAYLPYCPKSTPRNCSASEKIAEEYERIARVTNQAPVR